MTDTVQADGKKRSLYIPNSQQTTRENLKLVINPADFFGEEEYGSAYSKGYANVGYHELANRVVDRLEEIGGPNIIQNEVYSLKHKKKMRGAQMMGLITLETGDGDRDDRISPMLAFGSSHDKTLAAWFAGGQGVRCCKNNELFSFQSSSSSRKKHVGDFWSGFDDMVDGTLDYIRGIYRATKAFRSVSQKIEINNDRGAELLGRLAMDGRLSVNGGNVSQFGIAMDEWKEPSHEVFRGRNAWSLFNACTDGKKRGSTFRNVARSGNDLRDWFCNTLELDDQTRVETKEVFDEEGDSDD